MGSPTALLRSLPAKIMLSVYVELSLKHLQCEGMGYLILPLASH